MSVTVLNKSLFTETGSGIDVAPELWFADSSSSIN
jgi:hypothetical protein